MLSPINVSSVNQNQNLLQVYTQRISSGLNINSATSNPAGITIADLMASQIGGDSQAAGNTANGLSVTAAAGSALGQITENLQGIRQLTVQAGDGSLSASDLQDIQNQIKGLARNIDSIAGNAQFNGQTLLNGGYSGQVQTGPNPGDTLGLGLGNASSAGLGISGLNVTTPANSSAALSVIDNALGSVAAMQGNVGATAAGLNSNLADLNNSYAQLVSANSQTQGTDYAQAVSGLSAASTQNQAAIYAMRQYQQNEKSTMLALV